jgi:glucosyl-3-phosphoglycerate synthase
MSTDIAKAIFRYLTIEGVQITTPLFRTLQVNYLRLARDMIERYEHDALINGLKFDRHKESLAVESFVKSIEYAYKEFENNPLRINLISNWNRINSALPEFFDLLLEAVERDND